jgi:RNA polymerase sigma factor (sigma-70 family)
VTAIEDYRRWTFRVAHDLLRERPLQHLSAEDLAQEGLLEIWKAEADFDETRGAFPAWATMRARRRMREIVFGGRAQTGESTLRGKASYRLDPQTPKSLDVFRDEESETASLPDALVLDSHADDADLRVTIRDAVSLLDAEDREIVFRRYWQGEVISDAERARWSKRIRPFLADVLSDLAPATA